MPGLSIIVVIAALCYLAAMVTLAITQAPLGTPLFFALAGVGVLAYAAVMVRVWKGPGGSRNLFLSALAFAVLFRAPIAVAPVNPDNDMIRYLWDGRIQRLGFNPYSVLPSDPQLQWTHTNETRDMPSARHRTPYPPAAQLFFRFVVGLHDSSRAMKLALVACDLLTILVLWRWLVATGRSPWLTLAYAWNPLVVLEVGHSGHIDALGALWIAAAVYWLTRQRSALATVAFVLAVTTKLLPIVLAPLLWKRISRRDAVLGGALLALLYVPFLAGPQVPFGGVNNVVAHVRFNGPIFMAVRTATNPTVAAATAVILGLLAAAWCRWKLRADDPAAWAWPMAVALACAPVIYPWYLLYVTPFLWSAAALPLTVWTVSILPVYVVWEIAKRGGSWVAPWPIMAIEYGAILATMAGLVWWRRGTAPTPVASGSTE